MSRHEGVSCDSCMKANFRGRRYKCLVCFDYDLCSTCYEAGATTTRHTTDHSMQCILTRSDFDLYYGGEAISAEQPQSFACPYCGKMGYTDTSLQDHVAADHPESPAEVVCPICAALPGGDPNHVTDDFAAHLQLEHRAARDFEEPMGIRHVRRIPHPSRGGARSRRSNMQFHTATGGGSAVGGGAGTLAGLTPSSRETMDPIAELLSQLSSVRSRAAAAQNVSSQLQQLEMQLQSTRYPHITRQQLERLPRRPTDSKTTTNNSQNSTTTQPQHTTTLLDYAGAVVSTGGVGGSSSKNTSSSDYLLSKIGEPELSEVDKQSLEVERADRSIFVQELLLSSMSETLRLSDESFLNRNSSADYYTDGILNGSNDNMNGEGDDIGNREENDNSTSGHNRQSKSPRSNSNSGQSSSNSLTEKSSANTNKSDLEKPSLTAVAALVAVEGNNSCSINIGLATAAATAANNSGNHPLIGIANSNTVSGNSAMAAAIAPAANLASSSASSSLPKKKKVPTATLR